MTWTNRIEQRLTIITGDGKEYNPLWMNASKNVSYNVEGIDFIGKDGTYVERKKTSGSQFPLELFFQGENCIEEAEQFELSGRDSRPWRIRHPFYDNRTVQPLSMSIDNSQYNVSKINVVVWETLERAFPDDSINAQSDIITDKVNSDVSVQENFTETIKTPSSKIITGSVRAINRIGKVYESVASTQSELNILKDYVRVATGAANNIISASTRFMRETQTLINFPFKVSQSIEQKLNSMSEVFEALTSIFVKNDSTDEELLMYESLSNTLVSQSCVSSVDSDYENREEVTTTINQINDLYQQQKDTFEEIGYNQNSKNALDVDKIVNKTLSELYDIILDAKQERNIILNYDSNIVLLAHKYYGPGDAKLNEFIERNNLSLKDILQVRRGTNIKFYV